MLLKIENLHKTYYTSNKKINILQDLCLEIEQNEIVSIFGASGSGKSTLLNLIGLLEQPSSGDIKICNVDFNKLKNEEKVIFRKENIGFIFQNNQLLEDFNVEENVALPLLMNGNSFRRSISKANDYLHLLGIADRNKFKPGLLSGGEQQRVAIARALIKNPKILLADEPTGSLDHENTKIVFNFIRKLSKENKIITVFATHNLNLVKLLDKCFLMEGGRLIDFKNK